MIERQPERPYTNWAETPIPNMSDREIAVETLYLLRLLAAERKEGK